MKKTIAILLMLCLCIGLCACGNGSSAQIEYPEGWDRIAEATATLNAYYACETEDEFKTVDIDIEKVQAVGSPRTDMFFDEGTIQKTKEKSLEIENIQEKISLVKKDVEDLQTKQNLACLDLGHSSIAGREAQDCIKVLGKRLGALHVHDNDYLDDMHTLPGLSEMNWEEITKALADVDYEGDFTLETDHFFDSLFTMEETKCGLRLAALIGRKMINKIEGYKDCGD